MDDKRIKYLFLICAGLLFVWMIKGGMDAGISGDETLHYAQSVSVYNYFSSLGKDTTAINTPQTHLKYYGQSFDNLTTIFIQWFNIDNIYLFRHLANSLAGWLTIVVTACFGIWLTGYSTGIGVLILFALSPTFLGHAQNNLKDIPFALGYISSLFFSLQYLFTKNRSKRWVLVWLTLSMALSIGIRPGGLLVFCYLFFFTSICLINDYLKSRWHFTTQAWAKMLQIVFISIVALFIGILLWPYALLNPFVHIWKSYVEMTHFPTTIQQLFEGRMWWSDLMPWYYLPKYMAITIPLILVVGLTLFLLWFRKMADSEKYLKYGFILFSILFPIFFVIYKHSNLYGSWRHFLFVYPSIVLLSAVGFSLFFRFVTHKIFRYLLLIIVVGLSVHPVLFMAKNHPYYYLYYNPLVGGLNGAYGNYEIDYYYHTMREGSEWLANYLDENSRRGKGVTKKQIFQDSVQIGSLTKVAGNFPMDWYFRDRSDIQTSYCRYGERSQTDWDYMIVANSYLPPYQLKNNIWPPKNAIHVIFVDKVPVCAILKRDTKSDFLGYQALLSGDTAQSVRLFEESVRANYDDELIFCNFAQALLKTGNFARAQLELQKALTINPGCEPALMSLGNLAVKQKQVDLAINYYETLIGYNRKYFAAYVSLSRLLYDRNMNRARVLLKACLILNPGYRPALLALADSYRISDPEVAKKYDELLNAY